MLFVGHFNTIAADLVVMVVSGVVVLSGAVTILDMHKVDAIVVLLLRHGQQA